jgi:hypothetical protein
MSHSKSLRSVFPVNYTTSNLMPSSCNCKMCNICKVKLQFWHVEHGALLHMKDIDITMDPIESKEKPLVALGYTLAHILNETNIPDEFREDLFKETLEHLEQQGCDTRICRDFVRSWFLVEKGITCFKKDTDLSMPPPLDSDYQTQVAYELEVFGYNWAEASSPGYDWQKNLIDIEMPKLVRLIEEMRQRKQVENGEAY